MLSASRWASLPYDPSRDISLPRGPFLGCVGLSLQILSSHDLWSHLSTCFLNFNSCRAQAHVKGNFISVSSSALEGAGTSGAENGTSCVAQSRLASIRGKRRFRLVRASLLSLPAPCLLSLSPSLSVSGSASGPSSLIPLVSQGVTAVCLLSSLADVGIFGKCVKLFSAYVVFQMCINDDLLTLHSARLRHSRVTGSSSGLSF